MASCVYFVRAVDDTGPIKIGTAVDLRSRLVSLQTGSPVDLALLAHMPGGRAEELALHAKLAAHRVRGEWFAPAAEVMAEVENAKAFDQTIPEREKAVAATDSEWRDAVAAFIADSFCDAVRFFFSDRTPELADSAGCSERTARNWLAGSALPHIAHMFTLGRNHAGMRGWYVAATGAIEQARPYGGPLGRMTFEEGLGGIITIRVEGAGVKVEGG